MNCMNGFWSSRAEWLSSVVNFTVKKVSCTLRWLIATTWLSSISKISMLENLGYWKLVSQNDRTENQCHEDNTEMKSLTASCSHTHLKDMSLTSLSLTFQVCKHIVNEKTMMTTIQQQPYSKQTHGHMHMSIMHSHTPAFSALMHPPHIALPHTHLHGHWAIIAQQQWKWVQHDAAMRRQKQHSHANTTMAMIQPHQPCTDDNNNGDDTAMPGLH